MGSSSRFVWRILVGWKGRDTTRHPLAIGDTDTDYSERHEAVHPFPTWFSKAWKMCHHWNENSCCLLETMAVLYDSTIWSDYQVSQKDLVLFGGVLRQRKEKKYIYIRMLVMGEALRHFHILLYNKSSPRQWEFNIILTHMQRKVTLKFTKRYHSFIKPVRSWVEGFPDSSVGKELSKIHFLKIWLVEYH